MLPYGLNEGKKGVPEMIRATVRMRQITLNLQEASWEVVFDMRTETGGSMEILG